MIDNDPRSALLNSVILISCIFLTALTCAALLIWPKFDQATFIYLNNLGTTHQSFWSVITYMGDGRFVACCLIIAFWRQANILLVSIIGAASVHISVQYLKRVFEVLRPEHSFLNAEANFIGPALKSNDFAFPSGHSAITAMCVLLLIRLPIPSPAKGALLCIGLIVAISRGVVGAHWPSDIFGGLCLGSIIALCVSFIKVRNLRFFTVLVYSVCLFLAIEVLTKSNNYPRIPFLFVMDMLLGATSALLCTAGIANYFGYDFRHVPWLRRNDSE